MAGKRIFDMEQQDQGASAPTDEEATGMPSQDPNPAPPSEAKKPSDPSIPDGGDDLAAKERIASQYAKKLEKKLGLFEERIFALKAELKANDARKVEAKLEEANGKLESLEMALAQAQDRIKESILVAQLRAQGISDPKAIDLLLPRIKERAKDLMALDENFQTKFDARPLILEYIPALHKPPAQADPDASAAARQASGPASPAPTTFRERLRGAIRGAIQAPQRR
jgi:hypothetical protein